MAAPLAAGAVSLKLAGTLGDRGARLYQPLGMVT